MANLGLSVNGPTQDVEVKVAIDDKELPRIIRYLASTECGLVKEEDGRTRVASLEEMIINYANKTISELLGGVVAFERQEAAAAAAAAVKPIEPV